MDERAESAASTNELSFHYDNFYNDIPPYPNNASLTDPR